MIHSLARRFSSCSEIDADAVLQFSSSDIQQRIDKRNFFTAVISAQRELLEHVLEYIGSEYAFLFPMICFTWKKYFEIYFGKISMTISYSSFLCSTSMYEWGKNLPGGEDGYFTVTFRGCTPVLYVAAAIGKWCWLICLLAAWLS